MKNFLDKIKKWGLYIVLGLGVLVSYFLSKKGHLNKRIEYLKKEIEDDKREAEEQKKRVDETREDLENQILTTRQTINDLEEEKKKRDNIANNFFQ